MPVVDIKYIDVHRFWTTVRRFSLIVVGKTWHFIDFERGDHIVNIFDKKTPSGKKFQNHAARAARAASAIGVFDYCKSNVFASRLFDFLGEVRNGMIGFGTKNWHRGGTQEINSSGRGAGSAIGVLRICKSCVFAWSLFDLWGDVRSQMVVFDWKWIDFPRFRTIVQRFSSIFRKHTIV